MAGSQSGTGAERLFISCTIADGQLRMSQQDWCRISPHERKHAGGDVDRRWRETDRRCCAERIDG